MVAPVDGLFYRGKVLFGFPPGSIRGSHLRAWPQVSAVHDRGEDYCVLVHGYAREIDLCVAVAAPTPDLMFQMGAKLATIPRNCHEG